MRRRVGEEKHLEDVNLTRNRAPLFRSRNILKKGIIEYRQRILSTEKNGQAFDKKIVHEDEACVGGGEVGNCPSTLHGVQKYRRCRPEKGIFAELENMGLFRYYVPSLGRPFAQTLQRN